MTSAQRATSSKAQGARVLGDGEAKIGAHGKPVLFLHPKDFLRNAGRDRAGIEQRSKQNGAGFRKKVMLKKIYGSLLASTSRNDGREFETLTAQYAPHPARTNIAPPVVAHARPIDRGATTS